MSLNTSLDQPQCATCFKLLPWSFQGFDICGWCLYNAKVAESTQLHSKTPSYRTPYASLAQDPDGDH